MSVVLNIKLILMKLKKSVNFYENQSFDKIDIVFVMQLKNELGTYDNF